MPAERAPDRAPNRPPDHAAEGAAGGRPPRARADGPVLALEASTLRPGAALLGPGGEPWGCWQQAEGERGTAPLAAAAAELLAARGLSVSDLLGVAVGTGPGSYTGTRAAIAFARALVFAGGGRIAGVPSVAAAARGELRRRPDARGVIVLVDARRGEVYRADYARAADSDAGAGARELLPPRLVAGDDAAPASTEFVFVIREPVPDPYDVAAVGRGRLTLGGDDPVAVLPLYLKRSHAEIVFDERVRTQGLGGD
jgi:tRNA threonylcarbamoyl adenosine modification protein YeaZ